MTRTNNQLRQNILTGQWIIYAPDRASRPGQHGQQPQDTNQSLSEWDAKCPFCPGNESMLPDILMELENTDTTSWAARVVPNKYPAVMTNPDTHNSSSGLYKTAAAYGRHEVIIETPRHNQDIPDMPTEQICALLNAYVRRQLVLLEQYPDIGNVIVFRNHGHSSGTSLVHPHSQLIATAIVPAAIRQRQMTAEQYFEKNHRCVVCDLIDHEKRSGERIVHENNAFTATVPFAAETPYEVWIIPKQHKSDFTRMTPAEISDLASIMHGVLSVYRNRLSDLDYNYVIHSYTQKNPKLHWYLQIRPRMTIPAGFEIGSEMHINPSLPEADAKLIRTEMAVRK